MKESFLLGLNLILASAIVLFIVCSIVILLVVVAYEMRIIIELAKTLHTLAKNKILKIHINRGRK